MGTGNKAQLDAILSELGELCDTGYALALHIRFTRPSLLFRTYAQDWIDHYSEMGMMLRDPVVVWGFHHTGSVLWQDLDDPDGILAEAAQHGIRNGLTCAVGPAGDRSISGFTRSSGPFSPAEIEKMHAITQRLHELSAGLIPAGS
ncbi:autoinducer binding domain-containing protein [Rhodobacter sp. 140A]|nr:autoinducer binding domain-containing protein [Rhodobacter sp. 140A]